MSENIFKNQKNIRNIGAWCAAAPWLSLAGGVFILLFAAYHWFQ